MATTTAWSATLTRRGTLAGRLAATIATTWSWLAGPAAHWAHRSAVRARSFALQAGGLGVGSWVTWTEVGRLAGGLAIMASAFLLEFLLRSDE